jgi:translation initiation factor IF-3
VKVTIMFRGREQSHPERGRMLLQRLFEDLGELAVVESEPLQEGRNMSALLAPTRHAVKLGKDGNAVAPAPEPPPEPEAEEAPEPEAKAS